MLNNPLIFYIISAILIFFGIFSIVLKNLIYSLLSAIVVFLASAVVFYILGSEYNAIIQAAIYGLAVPVIIGISIMFTTENEPSKTKHFTIPYIVLLSSAIFALAFVYLIIISLIITPDSLRILPEIQISGFDTLTAFARGIFVNYVWAFELVSLLLTIVIAGVAMLNKRRV